MIIRWPLLLAEHEAWVTGPEDEFDDETNGDPGSTLGDDDESGFDEMGDWPDEDDEEDDEDTEIEDDC